MADKINPFLLRGLRQQTVKVVYVIVKLLVCHVSLPSIVRNSVLPSLFNPKKILYCFVICFAFCFRPSPVLNAYDVFVVMIARGISMSMSSNNSGSTGEFSINMVVQWTNSPSKTANPRPFFQSSQPSRIALRRSFLNSFRIQDCMK